MSQSAEPAPLLKMENVSVTLGGVTILKRLSLTLPRGRISALLGLNGAGKTTLLRCLLREVPYSGTIRYFCGHDHEHSYPTHLGYVPQRLLFDTQLPITVKELLSLALSRRPLPLGLGGARRAQIQGMLQRAGAERLLNSPVAGLSGGELQRVLLALALEPPPELLLLDEPAAGIDFQHQGDFYALIDRLNREMQVTVVLVSHDLSIVSKFAHHVFCLNDGRIQCEGRPEKIITDEMVRSIFGADKGVFRHHDH
jgi:zinc transport system ATP-binding protein